MERDADLLNIPAEAQAAEDVNLPSDAGERKRVLNILAQRRYRKFDWSKNEVEMLTIRRPKTKRKAERPRNFGLSPKQANEDEYRR